MELVTPLVSIIVPNYNHEKYLVERLESIFNQSFTDYEVILLDDCSTDTSRNILSEYATKSTVSHCVFNDSNSGNTFLQWNKGIALAKGDYIWIAESDDFCNLNFLEVVVKPLMENPEVVLSYCQSNMVNQDSTITGNWLKHTDDLDSIFFCDKFCIDGNTFLERFLIFKNVIPNASAVLFRKNKAITIGGLNVNPALKYNGDWTFYINLILNDKIVFIPDSLNNFRYHSQSVIANAVKVETFINLKNIILVTRKEIARLIKRAQPKNKLNLIKLNRIESQKITYEKAQYYFKSNQNFKSFLLMISVLNIVNFKKDIVIKFTNKFKDIFKFIFKK